MMKHLFILYAVIVLLLFTACDGNPTLLTTAGLVSPRTTFDGRQHFYEDLVGNVIEGSFQIELNDTTESQWQSAFWGMGLTRYRSVTTDRAIQESFKRFHQQSENFQRALLEVTYQLYPAAFRNEMMQIMQRTGYPKIFAMAVHYLMRSGTEEEAIRYQDHLQRHFPGWQEDAILKQLYRFLGECSGHIVPERPDMADLFSHAIDNNHPVLFSVQRKNRGYPGLLIIRNSDGRFLREQDGNLWTIPHFTQSAADLPTYITNGNSPQGVYVIRGSGNSGNVFIGPTPTLQLQIPYEAPVRDFFAHRNIEDDSWNDLVYRSLLPDSWINYPPIYDTFYAGKAGRNEIIAHGTTINPEYYRDEQYYPFTPSLGCMTALELWDPFTGVCLYSDQIKLMNAYNSVGSGGGYLILVELDDEKRPVQLIDIMAEINFAERVIIKYNPSR